MKFGSNSNSSVVQQTTKHQLIQTFRRRTHNVTECNLFTFKKTFKKLLYHKRNSQRSIRPTCFCFLRPVLWSVCAEYIYWLSWAEWSDCVCLDMSAPAEVQAEPEERLLQSVPPDARNHRHSLCQTADGDAQRGTARAELCMCERLSRRLVLIPLAVFRFITRSSTKKTVRKRWASTCTLCSRTPSTRSTLKSWRTCRARCVQAAVCGLNIQCTGASCMWFSTFMQHSHTECHFLYQVIIK